MICQLQTQCTLSMFYFREQLFTVICKAKHSHYFAGGSVRDILADVLDGKQVRIPVVLLHLLSDK